jgi:AraC-like DNA-binding protein
MSVRPDLLSETPNRTAQRLLEDVLGMIHLSGALIIRAEFTDPWSYDSPEGDSLKQFLALDDEKRLILFHLVPEGRCWVELQSGDRVELEGGDVVVIPYADQHRVGSPGADRPVPINDLLPPLPWTELPVIRYGGGGRSTSFVCGYIVCDDLLFNPFLRALPRLFRVRPPEGPTAAWTKATVQYALEGAPPAAAHRLFELIFVEMMRLYGEGMSPEQAGWLAALSDPVIGRALSHLHSVPTEAWTVVELAKRVGTSRSVLDDRFRKRLGRAPMRYLTEWRLQLAAELLRTSTLALAEIADRVGYDSEASFNRAFRRHVGAPPARWRDRARRSSSGRGP